MEEFLLNQVAHTIKMVDKKEGSSLYYWAIISIFLAIVLGSSVDRVSKRCAAIAMSFVPIVVFTCNAKTDLDLVGSRIERLFVLLVLLLWAINLSLYHRGDTFAKDVSFDSLNANIFYFR